jgi:hypothetical protein
MNNLGPLERKQSIDKNEGRREFQIDLSISLMNYALSLDLDGDRSSKQPDYTNKWEFTPCDCEKCFFCIHGLTSGVSHAGIKQETIFDYQCGDRSVTKRCTEERIRLVKESSKPMNGSYCRICVQNNKWEMTHRLKQKDTIYSTMGYNQCREPICKACRATGYNKRHATKKTNN